MVQNILVITLLEKTKPDIIINLAASVDFVEKDTKQFFQVNVLLPAIFGNYCKMNNSHLIHSSGIIVHGFMHSHYNVSTELSPETGYGKSKLLADDAITASGCDSSILRFGGIFGKNGPNHLYINKAVDNAQEGKIPTIIGTGNVRRNYIYIKDAAEAIVKCIEKRLTGIYYLGGEVKSVKSMLTDICEVLIPGQLPEYVEGEETDDRIIENSPNFNITPFKLAIEQMV